ncbi:hypothetical protein DICPUDRAFT_77194 [Dictyostelium purpureum]|uniref:Uncharacterized protein n=1 Tax=Dictyostelium purpureum TaxID=5786 RepID=F0ZFW2_DICPU|nr:uncharacterized protein DICPUDRAFT_77194 [Dictyostelium purpureum]EGC37183.1 hypothetical protein DICPUDRAFT_77194 [Dictyostelium purpureum]|eukprot:XP_003286311.1 hypothetical protein DICPUDRAFT_77194 [Dictyostelium purpureum]
MDSSPYQEDFNGGSLYYSDLPIKSQLQKDKYRHYGRKILFYLLLAYFITATVMFPFLITNLTFWFWLIHIIYFELDLTSSKNNIFVQIIHGLSFVGSFVVMVTSIILLVILNPDFISNRAKIEHHSVAFAWSQNVLIHWVPPVLLSIDLFLHKEHIRKRHRLILKRSVRRAWVKDIFKVFWCVFAPFVVVGAWFGAGFTIDKVYGVHNYNLTALLCSMGAMDVVVGIVFVYFIRKRDADSYVRLNN